MSGHRLAPGLRYFFTDHLSLAFEAGLDRTRAANGQYEGWLRKFTIAPQIGAGRKFFSRPVLRVFLTYATWSDGLTRTCWRNSVSELETEWLHLRRANRNMVVAARVLMMID